MEPEETKRPFSPVLVDAPRVMAWQVILNELQACPLKNSELKSKLGECELKLMEDQRFSVSTGTCCKSVLSPVDIQQIQKRLLYFKYKFKNAMKKLLYYSRYFYSCYYVGRTLSR